MSHYASKSDENGRMRRGGVAVMVNASAYRPSRGRNVYLEKSSPSPLDLRAIGGGSGTDVKDWNRGPVIRRERELARRLLSGTHREEIR